MRPGSLLVILDAGDYYGKIAEYRGDTGNGIFCVCPVGAKDSVITAWRWRATNVGDPV